MAETQPDYEGAWYCGNRPQFDGNKLRNFCPPEGCPKGYCARDAGWRFGEPSPAECTHTPTPPALRAS
jgi:hypothetical protein